MKRDNSPIARYYILNIVRSTSVHVRYLLVKRYDQRRGNVQIRT